jgi:hypothetical protein
MSESFNNYFDLGEGLDERKNFPDGECNKCYFR